MSELGHVQTASPHHSTAYQTVIWKDQALQILPSGELRVPTGGQRPPLLLPLPEENRHANLRRVELTWQADHFERCLTLDIGELLPPPLPAGDVAGIVMGEVHLAAVTTTTRHAVVVSGRQLRATLAHAQSPGEREALPPATRHFTPGGAQGRHLRPGRGRHAPRGGAGARPPDGVSLGTVSNQQGSQWPHGQLARDEREKAARVGMVVEWIDEAYSTRTCRVSGHVQPSSPRGRRKRWLRCLGGGARAHRDMNGSATICSKAAYGVYSKVQADTVT